MDLAAVMVVVFGIGVCLGLSGYGGFLVPPLLVAVLGFGTTDAVAHALCSFILPGVFGAWLYRRRDGHAPWSLTALLVAGTLPGILTGRLISASLSEDVLRLILGGLVLTASLVLSLPAPNRGGVRSGRVRLPPRQIPAIIGAGFIGGVAAVTAGIGGPLFMVPILALLGLELAAVVGAALLTSALISVIGAASLLSLVSIDLPVLAAITIAQAAGVPIGVALQRRIRAVRLTPLIAGVSAIAGCALIYAALS